jgi:Uma2 family endonuclease
MTSILDNPAVREAMLSVSVEQYHRLGEAGIIPANTELLRGVIVEQMIKSPLHSWCVRFLFDGLVAKLPPDVHVRQEQPLTLFDSEPEPDIAVVTGRPDDYRAAHPATALLVIEVATLSLDLDREKARVYASAGIPEYWIVSPRECCVEAYLSPRQSGYDAVRVHGRAELLRSVSLPGLELDLGSLFREG